MVVGRERKEEGAKRHRKTVQLQSGEGRGRREVCLVTLHLVQTKGGDAKEERGRGKKKKEIAMSSQWLGIQKKY